jgi:hypothetical protein
MVTMNLARRGNTVWVQPQAGVDASVVLGNGSLVIADASAHIQGGELAYTGTPQPGEYGVNQGLGTQAFKMIGYDAAGIRT